MFQQKRYAQYISYATLDSYLPYVLTLLLNFFGGIILADFLKRKIRENKYKLLELVGGGSVINGAIIYDILKRKFQTSS